MTISLVLCAWFTLAAVLGVVWTVSAFALKEARRRWPQLAVDPAWTGSRRTRASVRRAA